MTQKVIYKEKKNHLMIYHILGLNDVNLFSSIKEYLITHFSAILHWEDIGIFTAKAYFLIDQFEIILEFHEDIGMFFYSNQYDSKFILERIASDLENKLSHIKIE